MASEPVAAVLGSRGTLGLALGIELPRAGFRIAAAPAHGDCDIRDAAGLRALMAATRPDVVFNAAAYTDVDRAEAEPELAHAVNAIGAEIVARAAAEVVSVFAHRCKSDLHFCKSILLAWGVGFLVANNEHDRERSHYRGRR